MWGFVWSGGNESFYGAAGTEYLLCGVGFFLFSFFLFFGSSFFFWRVHSSAFSFTLGLFLLFILAEVRL